MQAHSTVHAYNIDVDRGLNGFPEWPHGLAIASIASGLACAAVATVDVLRWPEKMWIMALVRPLTMLFDGRLWLWLYWRWGRGGSAPDGPPMTIAAAKFATAYPPTGC